MNELKKVKDLNQDSFRLGRTATLKPETLRNGVISRPGFGPLVKSLNLSEKEIEEAKAVR